MNKFSMQLSIILGSFIIGLFHYNALKLEDDRFKIESSVITMCINEAISEVGMINNTSTLEAWFQICLNKNGIKSDINN